MSKEKASTTVKSTSPHHEKAVLSFGKSNYTFMLIGAALVAIGMLLMVGGASDDPNKMSDKIFDFQRLTLAPIVIITGYVVVLFSIINKPHSTE